MTKINNKLVDKNIHDMVFREDLPLDDSKVVPIKPDLSFIDTMDLAKELNSRKNEAVDDIVERINDNLNQLKVLGVFAVDEDDNDIEITKCTPIKKEGNVIRVEFGSRCI